MTPLGPGAAQQGPRDARGKHAVQSGKPQAAIAWFFTLSWKTKFIAVAVLMFYTNPDYVKFFFEDEIGNMMLAAGVGLQVIGYLIMKKIVNIEV